MFPTELVPATPYSQTVGNTITLMAEITEAENQYKNNDSETPLLPLANQN